ncbi:MAG: histidinol-phosphate transaminase [Pseudomonadota bacterium]
MKVQAPEYIAGIKPYVPGKPMEELEREMGIRNSIKLASNENPLGPSPKAMAAVQQELRKVNRYPEGGGYYLTRKLSEKYNIPPENMVLGNGSDDIIGMLTKAFLQPGDEAIMPFPSFLMYEIMVQVAGATPVMVPLSLFSIDLGAMAERVTEKTRMIFITHPNNPTGSIIKENDFCAFLKKIPEQVIVVLDEAYIEFVRDSSSLYSLSHLKTDERIVILRTFSKAYGLAGLRIGYGFMDTRISSLLHRVRQPFNVNALAQHAATAALDDIDFLEKTLALVHDGMDFSYTVLDRMGLSYLPSQANFLMIKVGNADSVFHKLLQEGVIVRSMTSYGFPDYIRLTMGLKTENERFFKALEKVL